MVKYRSKGNLPQKADYYALLNRSDADWRDTVRQGLVAKGNGTTAKADYGVLDLCNSGSGYTQNLRIKVISKKEIATPICGEYRALAGKRGWFIIGLSLNAVTIYLGSSDGNSAVTSTITFTNAIGEYDLVEITMVGSGGQLVLTAYKNGVANGTTTVLTQDRIYCNGAEFLVMNYNSVTSYSDSYISYLEVLRDNVTVFLTHCNGSLIDEVDGVVPSIAGITFEHSDYSTFRNDEYPFAVQGVEIFPMKVDGSGYAGLVGDPDKIYYPGPYPNTFTGNWHELTHAYFDKSNTDIWEDYVRGSINYISEEPNYWHVSELTQDFIDTYVKAAYAGKIFVGLDATDSDYAGAVMVFESGITADQLKDLNFWRKRKYFPERV